MRGAEREHGWLEVSSLVCGSSDLDPASCVPQDPACSHTEVCADGGNK